MRHLARITAVLAVTLALLVPLLARTRKGEKLLEQGRQAEIRREYEKALELYEKAMLEDPGDAAYQIAARRVRFQAAMARVDVGQKLRKDGKLEEALAEFQKAYAIDPASGIAEQEIKRTREMIEREANKPAASSDDRGLTPGEKVEKDTEDRVGRMLPVPELRPLNPQITTLKMNNQPVRVLYETVGKLAGINVVMDPEFTPQGGRDRFTIDLSNTTLDQALDHLSVITKTFWKPLTPNSIFVTADNPTKRRDYEDFVVKVFYIKNATLTQELQEIATTVRTIAEIRRAFTYNALNAILVRDTADKVALAEKIINDLDKPKSEVVIDVYVMQANRSRVRDLSAALTTGGSAGIRVPIGYNRGGTTTNNNTGNQNTNQGTVNTAAGTIALPDIKSLGFADFSAAVPGALLQAVMNDSRTRVLQQPQLRAVEGQKASLKIGDRVPYASGSFSPALGGVGGGFTPYAQTQFQFADVGVNVDLTPKVHGRDEISMHVEVEISNVSGEVEITGVKQPIISQRKVVHDIRIKEGEVSLLGGLLSTEDIKNVNGVPLLMQIPIFKYLFSTERTEKRQGELLIALIPHVVRAPEFSEANLRGISAGSDANVKLNFSPRALPPDAVGPAPAPAQGAAQQPAQPQPALTVPAEAPATPAEAPAAQPAAPPPGTRLLFNPTPVQAPIGQAFTLTLQIENAADLFSSPMRIKFDPKVLRLTAVKQGPFMGADGQRVNFNENTMNDTGDAVIGLNRVPGAGGITGSGALLLLTFEPVAKGTTQVQVSDITVRNTQLQPITVAAPSVAVTVQ